MRTTVLYLLRYRVHKCTTNASFPGAPSSASKAAAAQLHLQIPPPLVLFPNHSNLAAHLSTTYRRCRQRRAMTMKPNVVLVLVLVLAVVTSPGTVCGASRTAPAAATKCDPLALRPCAAAILWGEAPSTACCAGLRAQKRCLCRYAKNPDLRKYINSQNSRKVAAACSVPAPRC